jgi:ribonuclease BN (tRNA processing enzyme)
MRKALPSLVLVPFLLFGLIRAPSAHAESDFKVTLLRTASPQPFPDRFGPSTLVEAGDQKLLFDGVPIRLRQIDVPLAKITALFLMQYHSDHTSGIPDLWLTGWLYGRATPFRVIGPVEAKTLMTNLEKAKARALLGYVPRYSLFEWWMSP